MKEAISANERAIQQPNQGIQTWIISERK